MIEERNVITVLVKYSSVRDKCVTRPQQQDGQLAPRVCAVCSLEWRNVPSLGTRQRERQTRDMLIALRLTFMTFVTLHLHLMGEGKDVKNNSTVSLILFIYFPREWESERDGECAAFWMKWIERAIARTIELHAFNFHWIVELLSFSLSLSLSPAYQEVEGSFDERRT